MQFFTTNQPAFQRAWQALLNRENSDSLRLRRDPVTLRAFGRPVSVQEAVSRITGAVAGEGDKALVRYSRLLEGAVLKPADFRIPLEACRRAERRITPAARRAILECAAHIRVYHLAQKPKGTARVRRNGVQVSERLSPLQRVGVYVPGGNAPLVSTVLMNAIPARVAGVPQIVMATPPRADGSVPDAVLAAASIAGVTELYRLGGAAAIAALALGTRSIPRVDKIVGPGNAFVTEAKRQLVGRVGIDHLAGPSEIVIVADDSARPDFLAWDLLAQGEHGSGSVSFLLSASDRLFSQVRAQLESLAGGKAALEKALGSITLVRTRTLFEALALAQAYAPEHLSLQIRQPGKYLKQVTSCGAVFLGTATPQALGDYTAGPNHVLPTSGTARWASPLSVRDFFRYSSVIDYTPAGVRREGPGAATVADAEGLEAHASSIRVRFQGKGLPKKVSE